MGTVPAPNLYSKYQNPHYLVEFRLFSFNHCSAGCKNCYYQKTDNHFYDFKQSLTLAQELQGQGYHLETCYILPTDVFDNSFNYNILSSQDLVACVNMFDYVGVAATLHEGFKQEFFDKLWSSCPSVKVEMHVNLIEQKILDPDYRKTIVSNIHDLKKSYGERVLINLAHNCGSHLSPEQLKVIDDLVVSCSDDKILEMNFTFMFNRSLALDAKKNAMKRSLPFINLWRAMYTQTEQPYNQRTILRKPSFVFKDEKIYLSPILPFDEYVFFDKPDYQLKSPHFSSFLETYAQIELNNTPVSPSCSACSNLSTCQGKAYFSLANELDLGCYLEYLTENK